MGRRNGRDCIQTGRANFLRKATGGSPEQHTFHQREEPVFSASARMEAISTAHCLTTTPKATLRAWGEGRFSILWASLH